MPKQQVGVIGLAVMGKNLAFNIESKVYSISVYNRSRERTDEMMTEAGDRNVHPTYTLEEFVSSLETPRKILMMVDAGVPTDAVIEELLHLLDDVSIQLHGGN